MSTTPLRQKQARQLLDHSLVSRGNAFAIHYACEGFDVPHPRATSIAVRSLGTNQTHSFSLSNEANNGSINLGDADIDVLDTLEAAMLAKFFAFVAAHQNHHWLHWNMRDDKFGFKALENRFLRLGGTPATIPDDHKVDLAVLMFELYGDRYAAAKPGRLSNLARANGLTMTDFLEGAEQGLALGRKDFAAVHRSTLRKSDLLATIATLAHSRRLRTDAPFWDRFGRSASAIANYVAQHPAFALIIGAATLLGLWFTLNPLGRP